MDFDNFSDAKRQNNDEEEHYDVIHSSEALIAEIEQQPDHKLNTDIFGDLAQFAGQGRNPAPASQQSSYSLLDDENSELDSHVDPLKSEPSIAQGSTKPTEDFLLQQDQKITSTFPETQSAAAVPSSESSQFQSSAANPFGDCVQQVEKQPPTVSSSPNLASGRGEELRNVEKPEESPKPKFAMEGDAVPSTTKKCPFTSGSWWDPKQLHPVVEELIYWRNVKKSGIVFGSVLLLLLSLTYFSLISVFAYSALAALSVAIAFRIYKNVLQAVQKSSEGHPFKEFLDMDIGLPSSRVHEAVDVLMKHGDHLTNRLRSLFLVEDLIDSLKLALLLWFLTYVGAWFNGMTLIILGYVALFTLPKVYETYKTEIDQYLDLARTQVGGVLASIKAKIPIGKKAKEQ